MAFYNTYTNAPNVLVNDTEILESMIILTTPTATQYTRTVTNEEYERRGLTDSAKDACMTAEAASGNNPRAQDIGAGGWNVTTNVTTATAWTEV